MPKAIFVALLIAYLTFAPRQILANTPPSLINPEDNSTTTSSKLSWQSPSYALYNNNPFRVQIDNDQDFSSIQKDYPTKNTFYTPSLSTGTWYWRVKAKDVDGAWSDWSEARSFILSSSTEEESTPTPSSTNSPDDNKPSKTPSPTSKFIISNIPSKIDSSQSISVSLEISIPNNPQSQFFLKGAFKKEGSNNYFGFTKVGSDWTKNGDKYSEQFPITTDSSGNWTGTIEVRVDEEDSGFEGSGEYIFKVARYSDTGSGPNWSNESKINITFTGTSPTSTAKPKVAPAPTNSSIINSKSKVNLASVAGTTKESLSTPEAKESSLQNNHNELLTANEIRTEGDYKFNLPIIALGAGFLMAAGGCVAFIYRKSQI